MTAFPKKYQSQIKSLMRDERWDAIVRFYALKLEQWKSEAITGPSAFIELRTMHKRDGKVEGLIEFMDQMEKQGYEE